MRSPIAVFALFAAAALAVALPALSGHAPAMREGMAEGIPACTVKLNRKYDYSGRLYIQKVRICYRESAA